MAGGYLTAVDATFTLPALCTAPHPLPPPAEILSVLLGVT